MLANCGTGRRGPIGPGPGSGTLRTVELSAPTIAERRKLTSTIVVEVSWRWTRDGIVLRVLRPEILVHRVAADGAVGRRQQHGGRVLGRLHGVGRRP